MDSGTDKATSPAQFSLRSLAKNRIKSMIFAVRNKHQSAVSMIMTVDTYALKILSSYIKLHELIECGVSSIEKLELKRKRFPKMHCIYFVSPTNESAALIKKDFAEEKNPQYSIVHIFFTSSASKDLIKNLALDKNTINRISLFQELNLDFFPTETNIFSFNQPESLVKMYSKFNTFEEDSLTQRIAERLLTVLGCFENFYRIEMYSTKNSGIGGKLCDKLADILKKKMTQYIMNLERNNSETLSPESGDIVLIIVDRSLDPLTPFMHDFFYESMVHDLLTVDQNEIEYGFEEQKGNVIKKKANLTEEDFVFDKFRYQHIAKALEGIPQDFQNFVENNTAAKIQQSNTKTVDAQAMIDVVRKLPLYKEVLGKYILHMSLIEECSKKFEKNALREIGNIEQTLSTGVDHEGHTTKSAKEFEELILKLSIESKSFTEEDRLRLGGIGLITLDMVDKDRQRVMEKLSVQSQGILKNLLWLGFNPETIFKREKKGRTTKRLEKSVMSLAKSKIKSATLDLCWYTSKIEILFSRFIEKILNDEPIDFPDFEKAVVNEKVGNQKNPLEVSQKEKLGKSLRKDTKIVESKEENIHFMKTTKKVVLFMLGGLSFMEIRSLRNIPCGNIPVLLGSTHILNPSLYVKCLSGM